MSALYSLRTTNKGFIVTKFDDDFNVESYYEMTQSDGELRCGCPAGARPSCRHRQMFPQLVDRPDSGWFLDFDTRAWVDPTGEAQLSKPEPMPLPEGVTAFDLEDPKGLHNAVAEGVGEPEAIIRQPDSHPFRRRL